MRNKLKTICIIPARGGSKGLPGKNLRSFNKKPLIAWPIIAGKSCLKIDEVIVTTDSKEIADVAMSYGAKIPNLRPYSLATDNSTTEDTLKHALLEYEEQIRSKFDICVFLTCTDIFRDVDWLYSAINLLETQKNLDSVFSASPTHKNYWQHDKEDKLSRVLKSMRVYSSRQEKKAILILK